MRKLNVFFIIIYLWLVHLAIIQANPSSDLFNNVQFEKAFDIEGEPSFAILQDRDGFLWLGSFFNGLIRYDGYKTINYKSGIHSISNNFVTQLYEDQNGILWIGTYDGLNRYNKLSNTFDVFKHDPANPNSLINNVFNLSSSAITEDSNGFLWVGTQGGLCKFDQKTEQFTCFTHDPNDPTSISGNDIYCILRDSEGQLWIGTKDAGLNRFNQSNHTFTRFVHDPNNPTSISGNDVYTLAEDTNGYIWIGTKTHGLNRLNKQIQTITRIQLRTCDVTQDIEKQFWHILITQSGNLLSDSHNENSGLFVYNTHTQEAKFYTVDGNDPYTGLSSNSIHTTYEDRQGILWIVHNSGKVDKFDPHSFLFERFQHDPKNPNTLAGNTPIPIFEDREGMIWIGHFGNGLDCYDRANNRFRHFVRDPNHPKSLPHNYPSGFYEDNDGNFYVSTANGICRFDKQNGVCLETITDQTYVYTIKPDPDDSDILWMSGWKQNFCRYNLKTKTLFCYESESKNKQKGSDTALRFIIDKDYPYIFWIANWGGGLGKFNKKTETFMYYTHHDEELTSISSNIVYDVYEDTSGNFWVCTENGLNQFDKQKGEFKHYTKSNGFSPKIVHNVLEDDRKHLWMGTDIGLVEFDSVTKTIQHVYTKSDGLHSNGFFCTSAYRSRDGKMWFGGFNGLNCFSPNQILSNTFEPPVYIVSISQAGNPMSLPAAYEKIQRIYLDWSRNYFEFEYAGLNYTKPGKNQYQYILDGYDKDWYDAGTRRYGRYSGLPGGSYLLRIKASNNDGLWSKNEAVLNVIVASPIWKTTLAYLVYIILGACFLVAVIFRQKRKLVNARQLNEQLRSIDKMKDEFLANTSHELRTPLNAIIGIADALIHGSSGQLTYEQEYNLSLIISSSRRLFNLINDILDFSKLQHQDIQLNPKPLDIRSLSEVVLLLCKPLLDQKLIKFINLIPDDIPAIDADEDRFQQILYHLIANAIKFTQIGHVCLSAYTKDNHVVITVSDTGIGIPSNQLNRIFVPFEQVNGSIGRYHGGAGLGLSITKALVEMHNGTIWVESEMGKGTSFSFTMPISTTTSQLHATSNVTVKPPLSNLSSTLNDIPKSFVQLPQDHVVLNSNSELKYCILLVDDESINIEVLKGFLSFRPYEISIANSGEEALLAIEKNKKYDLVLLDVMMPGISGYDVCQRIRKMYNPIELPVIMVTAKNRVEDMVIGFQSGANDYLTKPISREELLARIDIQVTLKEVFNKHKLVEEQLHESESQYRSLQENVPVGLYRSVPDGEGRFISVNLPLVKMLNYKNEHELLNLPVIEIYHDPNDRYGLVEHLNKDGLANEVDVLLKRKDGSRFWAAISARKIFHEKDNTYYFDGIIQDTSLRKKAEEDREKFEAHLRQSHKMESIGTLAGGIAHDFNNILGIILGNAELASSYLPNGNFAHSNIEKIITASQRAKDLIGQLLSFSRHSEKERKPIKLIAIIKESIKLLRASISSNISIQQNIPEDCGTIYGDPIQIHQVMINLCTNSAHAMQENGGILEIGLQDVYLDEETSKKMYGIQSGKYVKLTVSDTGHGIAPEYMDKIFDPFFSTKSTGKGTGLGLSVVHGIVKGHDGAISVYSELGKGTSFYVYFPVVDAEAVTESSIETNLPMGNEHILLVDDEKALVEISKQMLERLGYSVEVTENPIEAIHMFASHPHVFDLVITDMNMPLITGDKMIEELFRIRKDIPVILCTGFTEKISKETSYQFGIAKYLNKPLDMRILAFSIREILDQVKHQ
ncbi:MAG: response regulator [Desulfobacterales bacterium]|nr:response regulator [Desulfobacterales bacterium]